VGAAEQLEAEITDPDGGFVLFRVNVHKMVGIDQLLALRGHGAREATAVDRCGLLSVDFHLLYLTAG